MCAAPKDDDASYTGAMDAAGYAWPEYAGPGGIGVVIGTVLLGAYVSCDSIWDAACGIGMAFGIWDVCCCLGT